MRRDVLERPPEPKAPLGIQEFRREVKARGWPIPSDVTMAEPILMGAYAAYRAGYAVSIEHGGSVFVDGESLHPWAAMIKAVESE